MVQNIFNTIQKKTATVVLIMVINLFATLPTHSQSVSFALKTSPNIDFDFNTINKYINGITIMNAFSLNIEATGTQWDLYVGATTSAAGMWDVNSTYSTSGALPQISILEMQFRNNSSTSLQSGFFSLTDISVPTYIIGSSAAPDLSVSCPNQGTNTSGSYLTQPNCFTFDIDLRIIPGLTHQAGVYELRIDYIIVQDL